MGAGVHNWLADETAGAMRSFVESVLADEGVKSRVIAHSLNGTDKKAIDKAYYICFNCKLKKTCSNCYADAYFLIRNKDLSTIMEKCKYGLKNGVVLEWEGKFYNNTNLTNEVAEAFLEKFPTTKWFAVKPEPIIDENTKTGQEGAMGHDDPDGASGAAGEDGIETIDPYAGMTAEEIKKAKRREADAAKREAKKAATEAAANADADGGESLL